MKNSIITCVVFIILSFNLFAQVKDSIKDTISEGHHQVTIFVFPTNTPLIWDSPSSLYKSIKKNYLNSLDKPELYLLGHLFVEIKSSLLDKPIITGMSPSSSPEKIKLVVKDKIGLGIMGAIMKGYLETEEELNATFNVYKDLKKLAFITYQINEKAASRMIDFLSKFQEKNSKGIAGCDLYGGMFWPRYEGEGSGCSAFGIALLDVANLLTHDTTEWLLDLKIPMELIGGEYNNHHKVSFRKIRKTKSWYNCNGSENVEFVTNKLYEPTLIYNWILKKRAQHDCRFHAVDRNGVSGLLIDCRHILIDDNEPLFFQRKEPNLFVDEYLRKN